MGDTSSTTGLGLPQRVARTPHHRSLKAAASCPRLQSGIESRTRLPRELRWNPVLKEWVGVATQRQGRTFLPPAELCPLCPTRSPDAPTEIPSADFDVAVFQNRFPAFADEGAPFVARGGVLGKTAPARGVCEVVVYTPSHQGSLGGQSVEQIRK